MKRAFIAVLCVLAGVLLNPINLTAQSNVQQFVVKPANAPQKVIDAHEAWLQTEEGIEFMALIIADLPPRFLGFYKLSYIGDAGAGDTYHAMYQLGNNLMRSVRISANGDQVSPSAVLFYYLEFLNALKR